jgi:hypothetical protein
MERHYNLTAELVDMVKDIGIEMKVTKKEIRIYAILLEGSLVRKFQLITPYYL